MKFFQWLKWCFSKQQKHTFTGCEFYDSSSMFGFTPIENGTSYQHNVQYKFIDCKIKKTVPPPIIDDTPYVVDVKIRLPEYNYSDVFILPTDENYEPIIIEPDKNLNIKFGYSLEPQLSEQEKEDLRTERFVDAMVKWNNRYGR